VVGAHAEVVGAEPGHRHPQARDLSLLHVTPPDDR
jgi:hypothetical protein